MLNSATNPASLKTLKGPLRANNTAHSVILCETLASGSEAYSKVVINRIYHRAHRGHREDEKSVSAKIPLCALCVLSVCSVVRAITVKYFRKAGS